MGSNQMGFILLLFLFFVSSSLVHGKYTSGTINTKDDWKYLDKFCYEGVVQESNKEKGSIQYIFWLNNNDDKTIPNLFLYYYDDDGHWPGVYEDNMSCEEKVNKSTLLSTGNLEIIRPGHSQMYDFAGSRPHFWYFAVSSCGSERIHMDYEVSMKNPGGIYKEQFSFDESGSLELYTTFFVFFSILGAIQLQAVFTLYRADALHPVVRLLTACILLELFSIFSIFIHYGVYAGDGVGSPGMDALGNILDMATQIIFILLLILLAKGWTITSNVVEDKKPLALSLTIFSISYIILFIWEYAAWDPATEVYIYESPPGIVVLVLRMLMMFWFLYCVRRTYLLETQPQKRVFFFRFGIFFTVWFFILPFIITVAAAVDPWVRIITVQSIYLLFTFFSFSVLAFLLWPSRASDYFKITPPDLIGGTTPYDTI